MRAFSGGATPAPTIAARNSSRVIPVMFGLGAAAGGARERSRLTPKGKILSSGKAGI
jgi:hypothetical protein